jgi:amidase
MDQLIKNTARQNVELLKAGQVSPLELLDAVEKRITEVDSKVNALPTLCLDRARDAAKKIMQLPKDDLPPWHLHGLPLAVKDLEPVKGVRTTWGSPIYKDHVPERSAVGVEMLERSGAVVMAKSNTPEFGAGANTFNEVFGATRNPWDTRMTCGGSSGGSAVALATGQAWLATGSDLGGSLRIPASFCSVVGLRPSPGRVASGPPVHIFESTAVNGPMGRDIADVAMMLDAQIGMHPEDPRSMERPAASFLSCVDNPVKPARIAYSPNLGIAPVDAEVEAVCAKAAARFQELGCEVEEACPDLSDALDIFQGLRAALFSLKMKSLLEQHRDKLKPEVIWNIEKGLKLSWSEVAMAELARGELYQRVAKFFTKYDVLLSPAVICPPFEVEIRYLEELNGVKFKSYIDWLILTLAITMTACPAVSMPAGFTASGLPVGLQMVTASRREDLLIGAATHFEKMMGLDAKLPMDPVVR